MDTNLLTDCISKLRLQPTTRERLNLIYQWITSRRVKLDIFEHLYGWCLENPIMQVSITVEPVDVSAKIEE